MNATYLPMTTTNLEVAEMANSEVERQAGVEIRTGAVVRTVNDRGVSVDGENHFRKKKRDKVRQ